MWCPCRHQQLHGHFLCLHSKRQHRHKILHRAQTYNCIYTIIVSYLLKCQTNSICVAPTQMDFFFNVYLSQLLKNKHFSTTTLCKYFSALSNHVVFWPFSSLGLIKFLILDFYALMATLKAGITSFVINKFVF